MDKHYDKNKGNSEIWNYRSTGFPWWSRGYRFDPWSRKVPHAEEPLVPPLKPTGPGASEPGYGRRAAAAELVHLEPALGNKRSAAGNARAPQQRAEKLERKSMCDGDPAGPEVNGTTKIQNNRVWR